jgi:hypothetical protein
VSGAGLCCLVSVLVVSGVSGHAAETRVRTALPHREAAPGPLQWTSEETREFDTGTGHRWRLTMEKARTGTIHSEPERPVEQTRLRIEEKTRRGTKVLAWLQHLNNTDIELLLPGDPRLAEAGTALDDSLRPWPNSCYLTFYDTRRPTDLDDNGRFELVVRRFAAVPDAEGSGLLLLQADSHGMPHLLPLASLVEIVRFEQGNLTGIEWPAKESRPVLYAEYLPLANCRFLNLLGLRGRSECGNCCEFPIVLRSLSPGRYRPSYVRDLHYSTFETIKQELGDIEQGPAEAPLRSSEEASLCRAAAFFYLTGTGAGTREALEKVLRKRADLLPVRMLLARLDRFFLQGDSGAAGQGAAR